jgi:rod shape-determining protein MreC
MDPQGVEFGIVEPRRGEFREADRLVFNGADFNGTIEDGTVIVSSGLGGTYPRGVWIGKVDGLAEADAGWRKSYWLRPMVEPGSVTHVLVGIATDSTTDLSYAFPPDSALTGSELAVEDLSREDSLRALGDSVGMLRLLLTATMPLRDSLMASLLSGTLTVPPPQTGRAAGAQLGAPPAGRAGAAPFGAPAAPRGAGVARPAAGRAATTSAPSAAPPGTLAPRPIPGAAAPLVTPIPGTVTPPDTARPPRPDTAGARSRP